MVDDERFQECHDMVEALHGALLGLLVHRSEPLAWELAEQVLEMATEYLGYPTPKEV